MDAWEAQARTLLREFFKIYPDYSLCRVLAANVTEGIVTRAHSLDLLRNKASQAALLRDSIRGVLDKKKVYLDARWHLLKDLTLEEICRLDDKSFSDVLRFYFKYPLSHNRVAPSGLFRSRAARLQFLRRLLEESKRRELPTDYSAWEDMLSLL